MLLKELLLLVFKDEMRSLISLNKEYKTMFEDVIRPLHELKPCKINSIFGSYEVGLTKKKDSYRVGEFYVTTDCDISKLCERFGLGYRLIFDNGELGDLVELGKHGATMEHKNIKLVYDHNYGNTHRGNPIVEIGMYYLTIYYGVFTRGYSLGKLTKEERKLLVGQSF